jgi:endonuclease I
MRHQRRHVVLDHRLAKLGAHRIARQHGVAILFEFGSQRRCWMSKNSLLSQ